MDGKMPPGSPDPKKIERVVRRIRARMRKTLAHVTFYGSEDRPAYCSILITRGSRRVAHGCVKAIELEGWAALHRVAYSFAEMYKPHETLTAEAWLPAEEVDPYDRTATGYEEISAAECKVLGLPEGTTYKEFEAAMPATDGSQDPKKIERVVKRIRARMRKTVALISYYGSADRPAYCSVLVTRGSEELAREFFDAERPEDLDYITTAAKCFARTFGPDETIDLDAWFPAEDVEPSKRTIDSLEDLSAGECKVLGLPPGTTYAEFEKAMSAIDSPLG